MKAEKVGTITDKEKLEIEVLYERRNALRELELILDGPYLSEQEKQLLVDKIREDKPKTEAAYSKWWAEANEKYRWKSEENGHWIVDFYTNEILLIQQ